MPELPDVIVYLEALERFAVGKTLERVRLVSPFLLRSYDPPLTEVHGRKLLRVRRLGKRIVFELEDDLFLVLHLMIAGRLRWKPAGFKLPRRNGLAGFDFADGTLSLTEASSKKRASLYLVRGADAVAEHDPGGLEVLGHDLEAFREALTRRNHTLKRALTDPRLLSGIGNAYSDEILLRAGMSLFKRTAQLSDDEWQTLFDATREVLETWIDRTRREVGERFPDKVTAFRKGMAVHGRFGKPCPVCGTAVQRVIYAENEANYCPTCQTSGRLLADRALSRLMKQDWPKTLEELEAKKAPFGRSA
ncbi:MAG: DNA-formamidopyrimidine glycosylase family protein [Acidobacteriota bacterium]